MVPCPRGPPSFAFPLYGSYPLTRIGERLIGTLEGMSAAEQDTDRRPTISRRAAKPVRAFDRAASTDNFPALFRRDALPDDLAVFLAFTDPARWGDEDHAGALKSHPAHLIAADAARV
jgi:hypothetical protein